MKTLKKLSVAVKILGLRDGFKIWVFAGTGVILW